MTKKVLSVQLTFITSQTLRLPENARVIRVGIVEDEPCLWYETPYEAPPVLTNIWQIDIVKDGHTIPHNYEYIGSLDHPRGFVISHLFISPISIGAHEQVKAKTR